jgi:PilZ domain-containing protein
LSLAEWANELKAAIGLASSPGGRAVERRREARRQVLGHKLLVRQRKALGILHLKNISSKGGCGITDMPLAVGSLVFIELKKPHFFAAEVRWARSLSIGLEFFRPVRPEMFEKLNGEPAAAGAGESRPKRRVRAT